MVETEDARVKRDGIGRLTGWIVAELIVVVLGVLIALQVEGWRERREARQLETAQLIALHADLRENRVRLDTIRVLQRNVVGAGKAMLSLHAQEERAIEPDSVAHMLGWVLRWEGYEPLSGAYEVMVNSGDIRRVTNVQLLRELAKFSGDVSAGFEDHNESVAHMLEMKNLLAGHGLTGLSSSLRGVLGVPGSPPQSTMDQVLQDRYFMYLLAHRTRLEMNRVARYDHLMATIERALQLIGTELEQRGTPYRRPEELSTR